MITFRKSSLESLNELPGPVYKSERNGRKIKANWILIFWFLMFLSILGQQGGIIGGVGQALAITFPLSDSGEARNEILGKKVSLTIQINEAKAERDFTKQKIAEEKLSSLPALPNSRDDLIWSIIITSFTIVLLINGKFSLIEKFCIILVSSFTLITILNLIALQSQEYWGN